MNEQKSLLILLIAAVAVTLGLYVLKAIRQVRYKNDERWTMIQLKANNVANLSNWLLVIVLLILQGITDSTYSVAVTRVVTYGLLFFGFRNALELAGILVYDKIM